MLVVKFEWSCNLSLNDSLGLRNSSEVTRGVILEYILMVYRFREGERKGSRSQEDWRD